MSTLRPLPGPYGGGGHTKAAGVSLDGPLAEAQATILAAARAYLARPDGDR